MEKHIEVSNMLISIIIPLYNKEKSIHNTLQSVLDQTYTNIEVVIIDDGSNDNSVNIVKAINDSRIKFKSQKNKGVAYTRNKGVVESTGEYVLFLDADDYLKKDAIKVLYELHKKHPNVEVLTANYITQKKQKEKIACNINEGLILNPFKLIWENKWNLRLGSFMIKKDCFLITKGFVNYISIGEDTYFTNQLLQTFKVAYVDKIIMIYNVGTNSLSTKKYPFEKHIENYFLQNNSNYYQNINEAFQIFKHFFRGICRFDFMFTLKLTLKFYNQIILILKSIYLKYAN